MVSGAIAVATSALNWRRIWGILRAILGLLFERVVENPHSDRRSFLVQGQNPQAQESPGFALNFMPFNRVPFFRQVRRSMSDCVLTTVCSMGKVWKEERNRQPARAS